MKLICILLPLLLISCSLSEKATDNVSDNKDNQNVSGEQSSEFETYYLVIADTSKSYQILYQKMFDLSDKAGLIIDTLNRFYDEKKDNIVLCDDDEDEMYRGEYFPRRFASDFLSLEYLAFYNEKSQEKMIALLAGIFENERSAKDHLRFIKKYEADAFILKSEIFVGCMH